MPLVAPVSGNLLRYPFFSIFHRPPRKFDLSFPCGRFFQDYPLTRRGAYLFLGLLALARGQRELHLKRYTLLKRLEWKLYNQDLDQLLQRLQKTRLSFEGGFYQQGRFVTRAHLKLLEEVQQTPDGLFLRFPLWVFEDPFAIDVSLFRRLSPLAQRLYLYLTFALGRGSFKLSIKHLKTVIPVLNKSQEKKALPLLAQALQSLSKVQVLEYRFLDEENLFLRPGPYLKNVRQALPPRKRPSPPPTRPSTPNLLLLGREHAGKTARLKYLRENAQRLFGLPPLYLPCLYSLTDWLQINFSPEEIKGLSGVEKRRLLKREAQKRLVLVDDLEKATAQKQQIIKTCLKQAPIFAATAKSYNTIPETIRLTLEKKKFREEHLRTQATRDLTLGLLALIVILAAFMGHHEWLLGLIAARLLLRQPS